MPAAKAKFQPRTMAPKAPSGQGKSGKVGAGKAAQVGEEELSIEEGQIMEKLTLSMEEAKVIHRRPSALNGDVLVEQVCTARTDCIVRRMRFLSNLELEQTEVKLLPIDGPGDGSELVDASGTAWRVDGSYVPYECLQGMTLSLALMPFENVTDVTKTGLSVVVVGLAGGMLPRFLRANFPKLDVDCVEIDPVVAELAEEYFGLEPDDHLRVHVADGIDFIREAPAQKYHITIIDVNATEDDKTLEAPPPDFITKRFIKELRRVTKSGGIMVMNILCASRALREDIFQNLRDAFHGKLCFLKDEDPDADENYVVFTLNLEDDSWPPKVQALRERVEHLQEEVPALRQFKLAPRVQKEFQVRCDRT